MKFIKVCIVSSLLLLGSCFPSSSIKLGDVVETVYIDIQYKRYIVIDYSCNFSICIYQVRSILHHDSPTLIFKEHELVKVRDGTKDN